jgi:hypothetical protein
MMALMKADGRAEKFGIYARDLIISFGTFGLTSVFVYFLRFIGLGEYRNTLDLLFTVFASIYGVILVTIDLLSTARLLEFSKRDYRLNGSIHYFIFTDGSGFLYCICSRQDSSFLRVVWSDDELCCAYSHCVLDRNENQA